MTQIAGPEPAAGNAPPDAPSASDPSDDASPIHDICPLLLADDGAWRSASASREHRCAAVGADVVLGLDKQRRLCLTASHRTCATYGTAMRLDAPEAGTTRSPDGAIRPYPRMAPVVLDQGRLAMSLPRVLGNRSSGQLLLAGLMVMAFVAIAVTRIPGVGEQGLVAGTTSTVSASAQPSLVAAATLVPSPLPSPSASPVVTAVPATAPPRVARTYKVRRGDTLSGIAAEFGTTVKALVALNDIEDPARIRVGAVLDLPD
jgi:LysM repeat protein